MINSWELYAQHNNAHRGHSQVNVGVIMAYNCIVLPYDLLMTNVAVVDKVGNIFFQKGQTIKFLKLLHTLHTQLQIRANVYIG